MSDTMCTAGCVFEPQAHRRVELTQRPACAAWVCSAAYAPFTVMCVRVKPIEICLPATGRIYINVNKDLESTQAQSSGTALDGPDVDASEIRNEMQRIRSSHSMSSCNRLLHLLNFVVESTLRGDASHLKETTIGVEVFGRSPDYDPKVDTIVRSQAWRLRAKLRKYYSSEGANDPMVIDIPTGQYVPAFHPREDGGIHHETPISFPANKRLP